MVEKRVLWMVPVLLTTLVLIPVAAGGLGEARSPGELPARLHWMDAGPLTEAPPPSPELASTGKRLYRARCSICHGLYGEGNGVAQGLLATPPRDFSTGVFKLKSVPYSDFPTDADLFRSITVGFPAYGMPSFEYLTERERWALVAYVKELSIEGFRLLLEWDGYDSLSYDPADPDLTDEERAELAEELAELEADIQETTDAWYAPGTPLDLGEPVAETPEAIERGRELFHGAYDCRSCHGDTGRGDGPSANENMVDDWGNPILPRDYGAGRWYFKAGDRPIDIVRTLRVGIPGSPMPSFGEKPGELDDLWCVAHYVRSLVREASAQKGSAR